MKHIVAIFFSMCVLKCLAMSQSELEDFSNFLEMTSRLDLNVKSNGVDDAYDEDEIASDNAWEESGKFEGDLILNERQRRLLVADVAEGLSRNGLQDSTKRWPNNEVIYYIQKEHFTSSQVQAIQDGIDDLAQASCVKFTPYKKGDRDAVVIQGSRRGCFSQVGYQGGYQVLNLSGRHPVGRGCFRHGTVVHELLHSLGFYHMQSSPDRDDYIEVRWQNIIQQARHNFRKYNSFSVTDFGVGYDYESVLHYSRKAFSSNGQDTLVPKQSGVEIGQRVGLSQKDIQKLNRMYCDADSNAFSDSDEDTKPKKPVMTKKNSKNKPFDGHGIGYHQGKTVVIKLKPAVELYGLPTLPKFHIFDYFSKAPQAMSPSLNERARSGKEMIYVTSVSASKASVPSTVENQKKYFNQKNNVGNSARFDEGKANTNNQTPTTIGLIDMNEFLEKANKEIHNYPDYADYNQDYSDYFNPERHHEKESEIIKVDKLFKSSGILTKDLAYNSQEKPDLRTIPLENKDFFKNHYSNHEVNRGIHSLLPQDVLSIQKEKSAQTYPLRNIYYNPEERDMPEYQSPIKYLGGELKMNETNSEVLSSLKKQVPLEEEWYTDAYYKQNPNENYDKESYTYDRNRGKENSNMESLPVKHYFTENIYNYDSSNQKPYVLFDAPIPLTHKWYKRDDTGR